MCEFLNTFVKALRTISPYFQEGSIVVEDPDGGIYKKLKASECRSYPRYGAQTHDVFMNQKRFALRPNPTKSHRSFLVWHERQHEIYHAGAFELFSDGLRYSTVLFYPFEVEQSDTCICRRYLYVKLESYPYWHPKHVAKAWDKYVLSRGHSPHNRSEDDPKAQQQHGPPMDSEWMIARATRNSDKRKIRDSMEFYDKYVRASKEVFLPHVIISNRLASNDSEARHRGRKTRVSGVVRQRHRMAGISGH
jgi:hypothetical protein